MPPKASIAIAAYRMERELPRTLRSLSPAMQRGVSATDYEVIVVDNGSPTPLVVDDESLGLSARLVRVEPNHAHVSPARALNAALAQARGAIVGVMIDGARIASPGIVRKALDAIEAMRRTIVVTLGFHLGPKVQMESILEGYDQAAEDRMLESVAWTQDGYRLFDISVFAGSSQGGWYEPIAESNALFMHRSLWEELGGFDERFVTRGGGLVNLDLFFRAVSLPNCSISTLVGEGTFHQVHGGIATNSPVDMYPHFDAEYERIRGMKFRKPSYVSAYVGELEAR